GGFAKFLWVAFVVFFPYLGVFVYLIARGHKMSEHALQAAQAQDQAARAYNQNAAGTAKSPAEELQRLADLKSQGVIDDAEFQRLKAKVVTTPLLTCRACLRAAAASRARPARGGSVRLCLGIALWLASWIPYG